MLNQVFCQNRPFKEGVNNKITPSDSLFVPETQLNQATETITNTDTVNIVYNEGDIKEPITYKATDSIVYDVKNKKLYLYGGGYMKYGEIELESHEIDFDWESSTFTARGKSDSLGNIIESANLIQDGSSFNADSMQYNVKTGKGRTFDVVTEQDGAYIHSEIVQKNQYNEWYGYKTKYTTCSNIEHPHFYLGAKKSKVVPDKVMVTGPVNLVVEGINTPLYLPFGIFPTKTGQRSGIIMPQYGERPSEGFFLSDGGYFWAVNDHLNISLLGTVFTRGRFGLKTVIDYRKIYQYTGGFSFSYLRTPPAFNLATKKGARNDFDFTWKHTMDNKAKPNTGFSVNINGKSSSYNNNTVNITNDIQQVQVTSNVTFTKRFPKIGSNFQVFAGHNQNLKTRKLDVTLPQLSFNVSRFTPFQKKIQTDKKKFYEKIGFTYTAQAKSAVSTYDSLFLQKQTLDDIQYGISQVATVDAPINILKYFVVNPSFNYNERWYFKRENRVFDGDSIDTNDDGILDSYNEYDSNIQHGFYGVRDFNFKTNVSTTLTGIYNFKGKHLKAIRHVLKPNLAYTFRPDFTNDRWGYVDNYYNTDLNLEKTYNPYTTPNSLLYGSPSGNMQNLVSLSLRNNFDMKVLSNKDTVQTEKKIPLIDQFTVSTAYDFTADSLKMKPLVFSAQSNLLNNLFSWNIGWSLNPYALNEKAVVINKTYFSTNKRLLRFENANVALAMNLTGKSKDGSKAVPQYGSLFEREYIANNPTMFYDFNIPWSLSVSYQLQVKKGYAEVPDSLLITANSLTMSGHINLTPKWQVNLSTGYDLKSKGLTLTTVRVERDLHCWLLAFNWIAYPLNRQTYTIDLHVKSPILQELKLSRKQPPGTTNSVF